MDASPPYFTPQERSRLIAPEVSTETGRITQAFSPMAGPCGPRAAGALKSRPR
jgi:hypothetical protein